MESRLGDLKTIKDNLFDFLELNDHDVKRTDRDLVEVQRHTRQNMKDAVQNVHETKTMKKQLELVKKEVQLVKKDVVAINKTLERVEAQAKASNVKSAQLEASFRDFKKRFGEKMEGVMAAVQRPVQSQYPPMHTPPMQYTPVMQPPAQYQQAYAQTAPHVHTPTQSGMSRRASQTIAQTPLMQGAPARGTPQQGSQMHTASIQTPWTDGAGLFKWARTSREAVGLHGLARSRLMAVCSFMSLLESLCKFDQPVVLSASPPK